MPTTWHVVPVAFCILDKTPVPFLRLGCSSAIQCALRPHPLVQTPPLCGITSCCLPAWVSHLPSNDSCRFLDVAKGRVKGGVRGQVEKDVKQKDGEALKSVPNTAIF